MGRRLLNWLLTIFVIAAAVGIPATQTQAANPNPVTGAVSTTINESVDGPDRCKNGNPEVNCNQYTGKEFVWLSGLPDSAGLNDGTYFFSVVVPGGQGANAEANPNDGTDKNLSDTTADPWPAGSDNADGSAIPSGDSYTDRTFTLNNGVISYDHVDKHDFDSNKIRLFPYDDTTNPGGVYILAVCKIADAEGEPIEGLEPSEFGAPGVNPSLCKYDAFMVKEGDEVPPGAPLVVTKDANGTYTNTYAWTITKDVNRTEVKQSATSADFIYTVTVGHNAGTISGVSVSGTITVTNPNVDADNNPVPVYGVDVVDTLSDGTVCAVTGGSNATITGATATFPYTCSLSSVPTSALSNTVTASWDEQLLANDRLLADGSDDFMFENIVFAENTVDECVNVTDTNVSAPLGTVCVGDANPTTFTYTNTVNGTAGTCTVVNNTATYTATDSGATDSAGKSVRLCVGADLTVTKDFDPTFTRDYDWDITKDVDKTLVKQVGGSATFNYTVNAWQTGYSDSEWAGTGTITITNPNDWQDIIANVTDVVDNDGLCTLDDPTQATVTVPDGESVTVDYSCTFPNGDSGDNTATATWDSAAYFTPNASATGNATVEFTTPTTTVDKVVTITDKFNGATNTLGTLTATNATPYASGTFNYPRVVAVPEFGCMTYLNTAKIVETGQNDSETVKVCGPVETGALTMGFWQNKNGQNIIKNGGFTPTADVKPIKVCNSGTWLKGFTPFQDLKANATCAETASYVYGVIKAADASGASMNNMLKAQMLATALDVYFSDPALGGNKIGAPAPVGGVVIDLTKVCTNIATCTNYDNVGPAFGGATKLTVSQILAYAASQSNAGGTMWYGNVKATQEMAKDTFDAINNEVAFGV